jgi:hypothetical protein
MAAARADDAIATMKQMRKELQDLLEALET